MSKEFTIKINTRIEKLSEGGWNKWSREVKMNLRAQGAWKYVTGVTHAKFYPLY
ncbi:MAG TPA: hypothetical protein VGO47_06720 [Chlamydiales bacterium]|nr:hypothetical protein [Chlamydiales bacterium]